MRTAISGTSAKINRDLRFWHFSAVPDTTSERQELGDIDRGRSRIEREENRARAQMADCPLLVRNSCVRDHRPMQALGSAARIRALTGARPIKPTSGTTPCCRSARQPNPGRRSTYRSGNSVRTTGATSQEPLETDPPCHSAPSHHSGAKKEPLRRSFVLKGPEAQFELVSGLPTRDKDSHVRSVLCSLLSTTICIAPVSAYAVQAGLSCDVTMRQSSDPNGRWLFGIERIESDSSYHVPPGLIPTRNQTELRTGPICLSSRKGQYASATGCREKLRQVPSSVSTRTSACVRTRWLYLPPQLPFGEPTASRSQRHPSASSCTRDRSSVPLG
jgi:hypothetical protein